MKILCIILVGLVFIFKIDEAKAYTLERETTSLFDVILESDTIDSKNLRIRGMQLGSLGVCSKPKTKLNGNSLQVIIKKKLISKGLGTGPYFDVTIKLPNKVKKVVFGKFMVEIWPNDVLSKNLAKEEEAARLLASKVLLDEYPDTKIDDYSVVIRKKDKISWYWVEFVEWTNGKPSKSIHYNVNTTNESVVKTRVCGYGTPKGSDKVKS